MSLNNPNQLFPNLNHCISIQFAVFEQVVPSNLLFIWRHILDLGEDGHRFTAVMYAFKIVILMFLMILRIPVTVWALLRIIRSL